MRSTFSRSTSGSVTKRPRSFLSKYARPVLPIITMSEPTDTDEPDPDSPAPLKSHKKHATGHKKTHDKKHTLPLKTPTVAKSPSDASVNKTLKADPTADQSPTMSGILYSSQRFCSHKHFFAITPENSRKLAYQTRKLNSFDARQQRRSTHAN